MLGTLLVIASGAAIAGASIAARNARMRVVEDAFQSLGGEPGRVSWGVRGAVRGIVVHYRLNSGKRQARRTICTVRLSIQRPAFEMDLRPETRWGRRDVEHGRAIDLALGDAQFDDSFLVEAAPAELARALLDAETRTAMLAFHPCRLTVLGDELRFTKNELLGEFAEVRRVLELCTHVGSRIESLPAQLHEERLAQARESESAGYRGPSADAIRALATSSQASGELAALKRMRARRTILRSAQAAMVVALGIVAWLLLASSGHR